MFNVSRPLPSLALCLLSFSVLLSFGGSAAAVPKESTGATPVSNNVRGHENTEWSLSGYGPRCDATFPRVLLVGDSITAQYQGAVGKLLKEKGLSMSWWASSYCLTSPAYLKLLDAYLGEDDYDVVHFNNGLHSLGTDPEAWAAKLREALKLIRARCPKAKIVWTTSTPVKDPKKTAKAKTLNELGAKVVAEFPDIATDDLFATMDPLDREEYWRDPYHFKDAAKKIQAEQVAAACAKALGALPKDGPKHKGANWSQSYGYELVSGAKKPRVLLVGDSITAQYQGGVGNYLRPKGVTTTYWAASYCLTHPSFMKMLDAYLGEADYAVIHFNNGLHSFQTPTEKWTAALREALKLIRTRCPKAKLVWATSTPPRDAKEVGKIRELNAAAAKVVAEFPEIATDDLFATMDPLDRKEYWHDPYHFKPEGKKIQARQVAEACLKALGK